MMKFTSDIDIDLGNREDILKHIKHIPAAMRNVKPIRKHASGVHVCDIPYDPINDIAAIDYDAAEKRGYLKLDLLNVHVYESIKSEEHLNKLMREPNWADLKNNLFVEKLIHLNNQFYNISRMPEPINSIPRLAMFLAIIRPGKKHLMGKSWSEISKTVWDKGTDDYVFKKSHSISYSWLVAVHANLLSECYQKIGTYDLAQLSP
jgi:hypothetical protein